MSERTFSTPGSQSLEDFETKIQETEEVNGYLKALGKDGDNNTFTIDRKRPPTNLAVLATYTGGAPPDRDGHSVLCTGDCLVDSQPAKVVAYRQN